VRPLRACGHRPGMAQRRPCRRRLPRRCTTVTAAGVMCADHHPQRVQPVGLGIAWTTGSWPRMKSASTDSIQAGMTAKGGVIEKQGNAARRAGVVCIGAALASPVMQVPSFSLVHDTRARFGHRNDEIM